MRLWHFEMKRRNNNPNFQLILEKLKKRGLSDNYIKQQIRDAETNGKCYLEHDNKYYQECIENLKGKGINIQ